MISLSRDTTRLQDVKTPFLRDPQVSKIFNGQWPLKLSGAKLASGNGVKSWRVKMVHALLLVMNVSYFKTCTLYLGEKKGNLWLDL